MRYEKPNAEVIELNMEDIVCLSLGGGNNGGNDSGYDPWTEGV